MYGYICEHCGAHLDPGEKCEDCKKKKEKQDRLMIKVREGRDGQMRMELNNGYNEYWRRRA